MPAQEIPTTVTTRRNVIGHQAAMMIGSTRGPTTFGFLIVFDVLTVNVAGAAPYCTLHRLLHLFLQEIVTCFVKPCLPLWPLQLSR